MGHTRAYQPPPLTHRHGATRPLPAGDAARATGDKKEKKVRKGGLAALRARRRAGAAAGGDDDAAADGGIDFIPAGGDGDAEDDGKRIGAKKAAKLAQKEAKREAREAAEREREDAKRRAELRYEEAQKAREEEEEKERLELERQQAEEEEKRRKEEEEYQAMKAMFSVDESGTMAAEDSAESQSLLEEFVTFVKETKVVLLEELASRFKIKTSEAITRLRALEESGRITGVMDDRGKYIYISEDEMKAVVKFMRQRGRVSISELAESSANLITLAGVTAQT